MPPFSYQRAIGELLVVDAEMSSKSISKSSMFAHFLLQAFTSAVVCAALSKFVGMESSTRASEDDKPFDDNAGWFSFPAAAFRSAREPPYCFFPVRVADGWLGFVDLSCIALFGSCFEGDLAWDSFKVEANRREVLTGS